MAKIDDEETIKSADEQRPFEVMDEQGDEVTPEAGVRAKGKKRGKSTKAIFVICGILLLSVVVLYVLSGGDSKKKKTDIPVSAQNSASTQQKAEDMQSSAEQAIQEAKKDAAPSPTPYNGSGAGSMAPPPGTDPLSQNPDMRTPIYSTSGMDQPQPQQPGTTTANQNSSDAQKNSSAGSSNQSGNNSNAGSDTASRIINAGRNPQTSFYYVERTDSAFSHTERIVPRAMVKDDERLPSSIVLQSGPTPLVKPPFGTMLPVRLMESIVTLRSGGLTRMELTMPAKGNGWSLPSGTLLIGRVVGGQNDRAYVSLVGFIDRSSNQLVTLGGELRDKDGASGIRGERKQVGNKWKNAIAKLTNAGVQLGSAYLLGRKGGSYGYYPMPSNYGVGVESQDVNNSNLSFVSITAGTQGYVMVSDLPPAVEGIEAKGYSDSSSNQKTAPQSQNGQLSDEEVAKLFTEGTPEEIKAALPRMSPRLRAIAEEVLKQTGNK